MTSVFLELIKIPRTIRSRKIRIELGNERWRNHTTKQRKLPNRKQSQGSRETNDCTTGGFQTQHKE